MSTMLSPSHANLVTGYLDERLFQETESTFKQSSKKVHY